MAAAGVIGSTLIIGGSSDNNYTGTSAYDWLYGGGGDDTLNGVEGDDFIQGGLDHDVINGALGNDIISYKDATAGSKLDLSGVYVSTGEAAQDTVTSIENVILYNARPQWLANAHTALDAAVAEAYGWGAEWRAGRWGTRR